MNLKKVNNFNCICTIVLILVCALSTSGCNRDPKAQKAENAPANSPATAVVTAVSSARTDTKASPVTPSTAVVQKSSETKKYVGKYLNKKYPKDFTELKSDGTFVYMEGKINLTGKYSIQGSRLLLALPDGSGSISNIDDRGITDNSGELWTK